MKESDHMNCEFIANVLFSTDSLHLTHYLIELFLSLYRNHRAGLGVKQSTLANTALNSSAALRALRFVFCRISWQLMGFV